MALYVNPMNDLATGLKGIAETVATVIDPNYKFKQAARNALASNPDLIRQLSAVEDNAPGTLEAMGFGKQLTSIIRRAPIPEKELIEKITRPAVEKAASDPKLAENRATQQVTGQTPQQISVADFQAALGQAGTKALQNPEVANIAGTAQATGARPAELQQEQINIKSAEAATKYIDEHPESLPQIAQNIFAGKIPMSAAAGMFNSPYGNALKSFLDVMMTRETLQAREQIALAQHAQGLNDATYRMKWSRVLPIAEKIGANPETIIKYFDDPKTRSRADQLAANPSLIKTDEDRELAATAAGLIRMNKADRHKQYRESALEIVSLVDKFKKNLQDDENDPSMRNALIGEIQSALDLRHELGGPQYYVKYEKPPDATKIFGHTFGDKQLFYVDKNGKLVDPSIAQSFDPVADPEMKNKIQVIYRNYLAAPDSLKGKALEQLQKTDPEAYNAFRMSFDVGDVPMGIEAPIP